MDTKADILKRIFKPKTSKELEFTEWLRRSSGINRPVKEKGECLEPIIGAGIKKDSCGYNQIWLDKRYQSFHRLVFFLYNPQESRSAEIRHTCDNPACCNPIHLKSGTHKDNMRDMVQKGRHVNPSSKLTPQDVLYIRSISRRRKSNTTLAQELGVSNQSISAIRLNQNYKG